MKNKEQILVVPVNYVSSIKNGFSGATSFSTAKTYSLYDSIGVYKPRYEIDNNICFIKISIMLIFKHGDKFLVKELYDKTKRPCIELGVNSFIKKSSGNYNAIYSQITHILQEDLHLDIDNIKINFVGHIRDLANDSVKSILGCIYYIDTAATCLFTGDSSIYQYKWYTLKELVDRYSKATSWSKQIIDCLLEETIKIN
jgi:predicted NUDIX family phosphoesterase